MCRFKMGAQLVMKEVEKATWGGKRKGAGRKPAGKRAMMSHGARPYHEGTHPALVTERFAGDLPTMREPMLGKTIAEAIGEAHTRTFRVIHFSIQGDHLHMVVEAGSKKSLARGMQGLKIRLAKRINASLGRRGRVFVDRYHSRALRSPREVRHAIRYVLCNWRKHVEGSRGVDPYSSARWFTGWTVAQTAPETRCPAAEPLTWLARSGWKRHGLLALAERPGVAPG